MLTPSYWMEKDILLLKAEPRPAKVRVNQFDFMVRVDWDDPTRIVGFEILDFGERFIPHLYDPDAIPVDVMAMRFKVPEANLSDVDIREVLEWAYRHYCAACLESVKRRDAVATP